MVDLVAEPETWGRDRWDAATLLGVRIDCLRLPALLRVVVAAVADGARVTVLYVNVHCLNVAQQDVWYARVLSQADIVYCDGTGVRLGGRLAGMHIPERMTGADWIEDLCRVAVASELSLYLLGGEPNVARDAAASLQARFPALRIAGWSDGFNVSSECIAEINALEPSIVLVGMGTPRQEKWIADHRNQIEAPVVWAVGALFSFVSGEIPRGPRWLTAHGLEWVCRLAAEPRKLWRRYLIGNPVFLWRVFRTYCIPNGRSIKRRSR